jgi:hypothetical protein
MSVFYLILSWGNYFNHLPWGPKTEVTSLVTKLQGQRQQ